MPAVGTTHPVPFSIELGIKLHNTEKVYRRVGLPAHPVSSMRLPHHTDVKVGVVDPNLTPRQYRLDFGPNRHPAGGILNHLFGNAMNLDYVEGNIPRGRLDKRIVQDLAIVIYDGNFNDLAIFLYTGGLRIQINRAKFELLPGNLNGLLAR